ncbi:MAG: molybdopterin-dependent oxidoreductase [Acidimicrobiales bacterium]
MESREVTSFCRICNAMCGIVVTVEGDTVVQVRGDAQHPLSRGYVCPKGRALGAFHHDPRRLDAPMRRDGDGWQRQAWPDAIGDVSASLRAIIDESGPDAVAMYLASGSAFDTNGRRAAERFLRVIGSTQKYTATTIDTPCKPLIAELIGGWSGLTPVWDHERSDLLVLVGTNPVVSHGHSNAIPDPVRRLREFRARGGELFVIDPRRTETAAMADHHLAIRPSTDHVLLAHVVRELLIDGADDDYLTEHCTGLDALREAVAPFDRATVAQRCGIDGQQIDALVAAIRRHPRVSALTGTGTSMSATANLTEWMLWALHIVTGSYDQPGGMWFNPGYLMQLDQRQWTPSDGRALPGPASRPELPRRFDEYPCAGLVTEIESGNIRAMLVVGGNPLTALPDTERTTRALSSLELLVVVDVIETDTTPLATHLWPSAGQLERADVPWLLDAYQLAVASQYTPAVVAPAHDRRLVWRMFAELGMSMGVSVLPKGVDFADATDESLIARIGDGSRGGADELLAARHGTVHSGAVFGWVTDRVLPDRRWRVAPAALVELLAEVERERTRESLVLIPHRQLRKMNSQLRDVAAPGGRVDDISVRLNPDDAAQQDVVDGDMVVVRSAHGSTSGQARVDATVARGAVALAHGWAAPNVCDLTSADAGVDALTGMVQQSGIPVTVTRVVA